MTVSPADEGVRPGAAADSVTFAFGDPAARLYGLARLGLSRSPTGAPQGSALAVMFANGEPLAAVAEGAIAVAEDADWKAVQAGGVRATVDVPLDRWTVGFEDSRGRHGFELAFSASGAPAAPGADAPAVRVGGLPGYEQPCRVRGTVRVDGRERSLEGLGQRGHAWGDPDWSRIELARNVSAWTDAGCAALSAVRPAGARHHGDEAVWAALWEGDAVVDVDDGRLSTTYDADGHPRRAGLELWPAGGPGEDWARRAAGELVCGSSLDLGALRMDCAFFHWHLEGRAGVGRYDIVRRAA